MDKYADRNIKKGNNFDQHKQFHSFAIFFFEYVSHMPSEHWAGAPLHVAGGGQRRVMTGHLLPRSWNWGSLVISHQGILGVIIITSRTCPLDQTIQLLYECVLWNNKWQLQSWHQAATNNFQQHKLTASICLWSYEHAGRSFRGTQPVFLSGILAMKADGVFFWKGLMGGF